MGFTVSGPSAGPSPCAPASPIDDWENRYDGHASARTEVAREEVSVGSPLIEIAALFFPRLKWREELRARWGRPGEDNGSRASWYFDLHRKLLEPAAVVDDKSWSDLEFPRFFTAIDTTITAIGRQCLFDQLRTYEYDTAALDARCHDYEVLRSNPELRKSIQLALKPLEVDSASYIADLLAGPEPSRFSLRHLLLPWTLITLGGILAAFLHLVPIALGVLPLLINIVAAYRIDAKLGRDVAALLDCGRMLSAANRIASLGDTSGPSIQDQFKAEGEMRKTLQGQIKWLRIFNRLRSSDLIGGLVVVVDMAFLLKLSLYCRAIDRFCTHRSHWLSMFRLLGAVDASVAIAGFLERYPAHCRPTVVGEQVLEIENGYHAFISHPVKNSIRLTRTSALITGSNMTGKTTFIKMVAMNIVLGHTLGICLADQATLPRSPVRALIHGDQSVEEGKSRYFAEAEAIHNFIEESATGVCRIFILDEPFSGTNTVERVAVAKAVLRAIGTHAQVLVTTHDVELQHLLGVNFELFHFQEDPSVEGFFDHKLHRGAGTQRNAIRVLERLGYPADIIAEALATVPSVDRLTS